MAKTAFKIFQQKKLIISRFSGNITIADLKKHMLQLSNTLHYSPSYDVINDLRNCNLQIDVDDIKTIVDYYNQELQSLQKRKVVYLASKPIEVAISHLYSDQIEKFDITGNIFSTSKAALHWLNNPNIDYQTFEDIVSELK